MTADEEQPLRVAVLGPVRAWRGDTELELGAPQRRAVLGLLAVRANQEVARDELIDGIWGEDLPAQSVNALHVHVARLRAALEPGRARRAPSQDAACHAGRGTSSARAGPARHGALRGAACRGARVAAAGDLAGAAGQFDAALRLWQGTALAGIPGPLAEIVRARLGEQRLAATEEHVDVLLDARPPRRGGEQLIELVRGIRSRAVQRPADAGAVPERAAGRGARRVRRRPPRPRPASSASSPVRSCGSCTRGSSPPTRAWTSRCGHDDAAAQQPTTGPAGPAARRRGRYGRPGWPPDLLRRSGRVAGRAELPADVAAFTGRAA